MASTSALARLIEDRTPTTGGVTQTDLESLKLVRITQPKPCSAVMYRPSLCVVAQGAKRAHVGEHTFVYDANHYLLCSLTLPVDSEIRDVSEASPFLGLVLSLDVQLVSQVLMEMDDYVQWPSDTQPSIRAGPMEDNLLKTVSRLVEIADDPMDRKILAPGLVREAIYTVLKGPIGYTMRDCVVRDSNTHRIAKVIRFLEENYQRSLEVEDIAKRVNMSTSALHHHFKQATTMSPIQFVKKLRLHRAWTLLMSGHGAGEAAFAVGYGSPSQFSREFRRLFGVPPTQVRTAAVASA